MQSNSINLTMITVLAVQLWCLISWKPKQKTIIKGELVIFHMMKPIRNIFETYKLYIILDERRMNIETWLEFLEVFIYTLEQGKERKRHTYWK